MYLNFSNFRGRTSAGGGTSLGPKTGTSVGWGGIGKIFAGWGDPPSPPQEKNPATRSNTPHNRKTDQLTHPLFLSLIQFRILAAPFIHVENNRLQARLLLSPRLKPKYLFTNLGINFELQQIRNILIFDNIIVLDLKSTYFLQNIIVLQLRIFGFFSIFALNYTQIENFDDVMFTPPPLVILAE